MEFPQFENIPITGWMKGRLAAMGFDEDEATSIVHDAYMKAVEQFDPSYGSAFATYFANKALYAGRDEVRKRANTRVTEVPLLEELEGAFERPWFRDDFLDCLGDAARFLVQVVLDWPEELETEACGYPAPYPTPNSIRAAAKRIAVAAGFSHRDIVRAMREIRTELGS